MSKKIIRQFACSKMMLPEHRDSLQSLKIGARREEIYRRPFFDDQRQEELQQLLDRAILKQQALRFTILSAGGTETFTATPLRIEPSAGLLCLDNGSCRLHKVLASDVIDIETA